MNDNDIRNMILEILLHIDYDIYKELQDKLLEDLIYIANGHLNKMKLSNIEHKTIHSGPISREDEIVIPIYNTERADRLREALKLVDKYRKIANMKVTTKFSDWSMFEYCVKNDRVIVTVKQGACG